MYIATNLVCCTAEVVQRAAQLGSMALHASVGLLRGPALATVELLVAAS